MKSVLKNAIIMLVLVTITFACNKDPEMNFNEGEEFCSCLTMDNINKTIPIVNDFLARLPNEMRLNNGYEHSEQIYELLVKWLKSFPCDTDAKILIGKDWEWGHDVICGVAISIKDNEMVRELEFDFACIDNRYTFTQIAGYLYDKQDAIHVATKYTKMDDLFGFINSLEFDVKEIQYGTFISSLPSDSTNLKNITNTLKAKPYTRDYWVVGHLNWYLSGITFFVQLYDMHNRDYQANWIKTMDEYKLIEYDYPDYKESVIDGIVYGPGDVIVFMIPEGTGKQWETKFMEYDFVRWAQMSYTRYTIR
ncbi:MAG: hypothetical protein LBI82_11675 [Dysgonamonadaceae bacterium]|jgi:hypothetical protein|nr:hypothetical protein [Dysgonamonadaceae bacterium]